MTIGRSSGRRSPAIFAVAIAATMTAMAVGHPAVAEVVGGAAIVLASVVVGSKITRRAALEVDLGRALTLDLLLVLVVLLGLAGVAVVGLAIP
jgi:hypothetical protein